MYKEIVCFKNKMLATCLKKNWTAKKKYLIQRNSFMCKIDIKLDICKL